jgi:hypothetical protein
VGEIPATLGNCHQLTILDFTENRLSGDIPITFGSLQAMEQFVLYNNSLEGNPPETLVNMANLTRVNYLWKNKLNGIIAAFCSSNLFLSFDVIDNVFDGEIPPQLGNSTSLERLRLGNNQFMGPVSETLRKSNIYIYNKLNNTHIKLKIRTNH